MIKNTLMIHSASRPPSEAEIWTWCPNCMDRQRHTVVQGGIQCKQCSYVHHWTPKPDEKREEV